MGAIKAGCKKEMPPGSRNYQRCTNSSYKMEVCRGPGRDETLQTHITIASGKSLHHKSLCYRADADPTIGHCLQWKHPKEQQLAGESHSPDLCSPGCSAPPQQSVWESPWRQSCSENLTAKPAGNHHTVGAESWSGSHISSAAGTELCGSQENFRRIFSWYIC